MLHNHQTGCWDDKSVWTVLHQCLSVVMVRTAVWTDFYRQILRNLAAQRWLFTTFPQWCTSQGATIDCCISLMVSNSMADETDTTLFLKICNVQNSSSNKLNRFVDYCFTKTKHKVMLLKRQNYIKKRWTVMPWCTIHDLATFMYTWTVNTPA